MVQWPLSTASCWSSSHSPPWRQLSASDWRSLASSAEVPPRWVRLAVLARNQIEARAAIVGRSLSPAGESEGPTKPRNPTPSEARHRVMTRMRNPIKREEGVAAVELALVLPILFLILFRLLEQRDHHHHDQGGVPVRVKRLSLVRLRDEQHGAVLMIVAICMIIMLGMLVLVFDLGRSVGIKRNMVAGADAASLAAARACAEGQPMGTAQTAATTLITDNNAAATMTDFQADPVQCSGIPGQLQQNVSDVTVKSSVPVEYFFAPIFGLNNGTVTSQATAQWGPAIGVANPVPLRLTSLQVDGCLATPIGSASADCAFGFDNDDPNSGSTWGVLNFPEGWPAANPNPPDCGGNT